MKATKRIPIQWDDATLERAIAGRFTVYRWDRPEPYTLTKQERVQFEQAKEQGYVVHGNRPNLLHVFYTWCDIHHCPHIRIARAGRCAKVVMDIPFQEKVLSSWSQELARMAVDYASGPRSYGSVGPIYTYAERLDPDRAEFLARSFVAIYKRNAGEEVALPPCPVPHPANKQLPRLEEAKQRRYVATHTVRDLLGVRWELYCRARGLPYLRLHEPRKGRARLDVRLPDGFLFTPDMQQHITYIGQEIQILNCEDVRNFAERRWYAISEKDLTIRRPVPTDDAIYFTQALVHILERAGYFQEREMNAHW